MGPAHILYILLGLTQMTEIDTQIAEAQSEALKTGDWHEYNKLTTQTMNDAATSRRVTEIEAGKTLFLPDFKRLETSLRKKLVDPAISFDERTRIQDELTTLSLRWTESGIGDIDVVIGMRDSLVKDLQEADKMHLSYEDRTAIFGERVQHLKELEKIISQAEAKGLV